MLQQAPLALRETYDRAFFAAQIEGSSRSASVMVPRILELFPRTASVVDLGCGTGVWLHHFRGAGVPRVLGLDGGAPDDGMLLLRRGEFRSVNLAEPLHLPDRFDLAMSIEVAEHLPPSAAETFVANLCRLSDAVVFGAAIPGQDGTWHVNERWPSYWAALFGAEGYELFDVLRPQVWYDRRVESWYAQNTLVFVRRGRDDLTEGARTAAQREQARPLDLVHPRCFEAFRRSLEIHKQTLSAEAEAEAEAEARVAATEARAIEAEARVAAAEARVAAAEARATEAEARLTAILHSASWRITGPVRRLAEPFPRLRAGARAVLAPVWRTARAVSHALFPPRLDADDRRTPMG